MWPIIGQAAHHDATPTSDLRVPGVTSGGDGAQPAGSRPHREIILVAMLLLVALGSLVSWMLFKSANEDDSAARAAAAELGLTVSNDWKVETIDGGFRLVRVFGADSAMLDVGYHFDFVETPAVSRPADASKWTPHISGATAYAEGEPPVRLFIDGGKHSWIVTTGALTSYQSDEPGRGIWYELQNSIKFTSAT